jgi:hypothetical protein
MILPSLIGDLLAPPIGGKTNFLDGWFDDGPLSSSMMLLFLLAALSKISYFISVVVLCFSN